MSATGHAPPQRDPPFHLAANPAAGPALPRPLTSFVGREREIAEVRECLLRDDVRLLTLVGPGGVGKTRLAIRGASEVAPRFEGTWFVPLAALRDPALVPAAISRALGLRQASEQDVVAAIVAALNGRSALLVLDNLEHLLTASAIVTDLLHACPSLTILTTSRVVLRLSGERVLIVPPLPVAPDADLPPAELLRIDAVQLFMQRAQARDTGFTLTAANAPDVSAICRRLDGLPLAIELAAARIGALSPALLEKRLDARLALLGDGPRDQPARLRSLRDSIAWSHDLLDEREQALFRRLAIFDGPWTLDGAEAVVADDGVVPRSAVLEGVASLVASSLIRQEPASGGDAGYLMLETIREYAAGRLAASGEADLLARRLVDYVVSLAAEVENAFYLPDGSRRLARVEFHHASVRGALRWLEQQGPATAETLLTLAARLSAYWVRGGVLHEGRAWLEEALARRPASPGAAGKAHYALARILHLQGDERSALAHVELALDQAGNDGNVWDRLHALTLKGLITLRLGDLETSSACQRAALAALEDLLHLPGAELVASTVLGHLGNVAVARGDIAAAATYFSEAIVRQEARGLQRGTSHPFASHPIAGLGDVARALGDLPTALARYQEALGLAWRYDDRRAIAYALGGIAGTLAAAGAWRTAARLFGADEAWHRRTGYSFDLETLDRQRALGLPEPWQRAGEPFGSGQPLRDALGGRPPVPLPSLPDPAAAEALWEEGRHLAIDVAVAEALVATFDGRRYTGPTGLSPREVEVLRLVMEGRTDAEIASTLYISRRTVSAHVQHILDKLDVPSRAAAAAIAVRQGIA